MLYKHFKSELKGHSWAFSAFNLTSCFLANSNSVQSITTIFGCVCAHRGRVTSPDRCGIRLQFAHSLTPWYFKVFILKWTIFWQIIKNKVNRHAVCTTKYGVYTDQHIVYCIRLSNGVMLTFNSPLSHCHTPPLSSPGCPSSPKP